MKTRLLITDSFSDSVSHYVGKYIEIPEELAAEKHIKPGTHEAGIILDETDELKINYHGGVIWLPLDQIKITSVEKKGVFDFEGDNNNPV